MKRAPKWIVAMCACIVLAIIAGFIVTRGDYPVASLPSSSSQRAGQMTG